MANLSNINNKFLVTTGGNVLIGQTADDGNRLQVNGAANIKGTANFAPVLTLGTSGVINAVINSADEMFFNIDSNDNQSNASFHFGHNSTTGNGSTKLMTIKDNGTVAFGPDAQDIQIIPSSTGGGLNKVYLRGNAIGDKAEISLNHYGYANLFIGVGTTANTVMSLTATSGGTDGIIINTSGNVGIGTATPSSFSGYTNLSLKAGSTGNNLDFFNSAGTRIGAIVTDGSDDVILEASGLSKNLIFKTDNAGTFSEKMRITSAGNIQFAQDGYINTNTADASDNLSLQLSGGGAFGDTRGACIALAGNENGNGGLIQLRAGQGQYSEVRTYTSGVERTRVEDNGDFILYGGRLYLNSGTGYNNTGYIYLSNGRTAIESNIVNLTANGDTSLNFKTRSGGATSSAMYIDEFRNVGIGTTTPSYKLEVSSKTRLYNVAIGGTDGGLYNVYSDSVVGINNLHLAAQGSGAVYVNSALARPMYINPLGGDVGIGTLTPRARLEVVGDTTIQNGVYTYQTGGYTSGATAINVDITVGNEGGGGNVFKIEAGFAHYYAMTYNSLAEWWCTSRGTAVVNTYILNAGTTAAGDWSASKPNATTLRVTKSAGTYGGGGKWWFKVTYIPF